MNNTAPHISVGKIGEDIATLFLERKGYKVIDRNYSRKWGELDIVAQKKKELYFVEVKSVSRGTGDSVTRENNDSSLNHRPEDNVHPAKLKRLSRIVQTYLLDKNVSQETSWQFLILTVIINLKDKKARVKILKDILPA